MNQNISFSIKKREDVGLKHLTDPNASVEYSKHMDDVYNIIDDYNQNRKRKILVVFDDMIADIMIHEKNQATIKELLLLHNLIFSVPKEFRLISTTYLLMKIHNKRELQNIATNHSAEIDNKGFMKIYRKCTSEPCSFLTIDTN